VTLAILVTGFAAAQEPGTRNENAQLSSPVEKVPDAYFAEITVIQGPCRDVHSLLEESGDEKLAGLAGNAERTGFERTGLKSIAGILHAANENHCSFVCSPTLIAQLGRKATVEATLDFSPGQLVEASGEWEWVGEQPAGTGELLFEWTPKAGSGSPSGTQVSEVTVQLRHFFVGASHGKATSKTDRSKSLTIPGFSVRRTSMSISQSDGEYHVALDRYTVSPTQPATTQVQPVYWRNPDGSVCPCPAVPTNPGAANGLHAVAAASNDPGSVAVSATLIFIKTGKADCPTGQDRK